LRARKAARNAILNTCIIVCNRAGESSIGLFFRFIITSLFHRYFVCLLVRFRSHTTTVQSYASLFGFLHALLLDKGNALAVLELITVLTDALVQRVKATIIRSIVTVGRARNGVTSRVTAITVRALDKAGVALAFSDGVDAPVRGCRVTIGGTGNVTALGHAGVVHAVVVALADAVAKVGRALLQQPVARLKVRIGRARVATIPEEGQFALFVLLLLWLVQRRRRGLKMRRR
jgi:hypothetical protein